MRLSSVDFVAKSRLIHGDLYDYSSVVYQKSSSKVEIICNDHGSFWQTPNSHLRGRGCPICAKFKAQVGNNDRRLSLSEFVVRANFRHGDRYGYDLIDLKSTRIKVKILCKVHGLFEQAPVNHMNGQGCPTCAVSCRNQGLSIGQAEFLRRAKDVHGDLYDYSKSVFSIKQALIEIGCPVHGFFYQLAASHLNGRGCPQCGIVSIRDRLKLDFHEVVARGKFVHGDVYDYDESTYRGTKEKMRLICQTHGEFWQSPAAHFLGGGCYRCGVSAFQKSVIDYVESIGINDLLLNDRGVLDGLELDLYSPKNNVAIECNGVYWHSYDGIESRPKRYRHYNKHDRCNRLGVKLISITDEEWSKHNYLVKSMIAHRFNKTSDRIYARDCQLVVVPVSDYRAFVNLNHIAGYRSASVVYGLRCADRFVAMMSFSSHNKYQYEVIRFCSLANMVVLGAGSRLFSAFLVGHSPKLVMSYADRRFSSGGLYLKLGMCLDGITAPNYRYVKNGVTFSRQQFQKSKLVYKLNHFDSSRSESFNMFSNGYRRLWDAGHYRFLWSGNG